jgi:hypothetical protein
MEIAAELMPALDYRQYFSSIANYDFFNLFVIKGEDFKKNSFVLRADRVLTEDIDADVAVMFPRLDEQITAKVKTYPSIFMSENHGYKQASIDQVAYYGYVTDINPKSSFAKSTVTVSFQAFVPLPQQRLNILTAQLGLDYKDGNDRLSREHFIIKKINL